jgi:CRP-like cAMP-binding protein
MVPHSVSPTLHHILRKGKQYNFGKGQVLQYPSEQFQLSLVSKGFVKRYLITNEGNISVQAIYGPGDIFPLTPVFKLLFDQAIYSGPEVYYYETMAPSEIFAINGDHLKDCLQKDPLLYRELLSESGRRLQSNIQQLENISLKNAYNQVAHQLVFFAQQFGEKRLRSTRIMMPLTQQDLADIINVTRETVSLSISQLKKKGLLSKHTHLVVPNIKKLQDEAYNAV